MRWNTIYFSHKREKNLETNSDIVEYNFLLDSKEQIKNDFPKFSFISENTTLISDLTQTEDELYNKIAKNSRYKIRRAEREGVKVHFYDSNVESSFLQSIIGFYNEFVDTKDELSFKLCYNYLKPFIENGAFFTSQAADDNGVLIEHIYYLDKDRVRLWYSASLFRNDDTKKRNEIGRANRYLHWRDMQYFKMHGFSIYDWGGYSTRPEVAKISEFKKSFGGEIQKGTNILTYNSLIGLAGLLYLRIKS